MKPFQPANGFPSFRTAFTLIEIMVAVALLSFIVLGLLAMFNQTQRAFRSSMTQTDVLESGRAATEMLAREIQQATPSQIPDMIIGGDNYRATNFVSWPSSYVPRLQQGLPGATVLRTNFVQDLFFIIRENQAWTGIGYRVMPRTNAEAVGALYRFSVTTDVYSARFLSQWIAGAAYISQQNLINGRSVTNVPVSSSGPLVYVSRIADGLVHLRTLAFATNGYAFYGDLNFTNRGAFYSYEKTNSGFVNNSYVYDAPATPQWGYSFFSNAVPASVELEVGFLEQQVFQRYKAIGVAAAQNNYLSNHVAQVHVFRQRIPIRNVDFSAYQ